jgi:hypothetical protein
MTDDEFLQAFMNCTLPNDQFRHRDHLHLAWLLARRLGTRKHASPSPKGSDDSRPHTVIRTSIMRP